MYLGERFVFHNDQLPSACFSIFRDMRQRDKLCDIVIKIGNHSISAHRLVLAAAIPYFRDMFHDSKSRSDVIEITMRDMDPTAFESLIDFAYTYKVEINEDNVYTLLRASCFLKIDDVNETCCDFLGKRLCRRNVLAIREMAGKLNCKNLMERTETYICENFDEISQTEEFLRIPYCYLRDLLARNDLQTLSEERVFQAVMKWVKKYPHLRKNMLPGLLANIRLTLLTPEFIRDHVLTEEYIRESIACRDVLDKVTFYHLLPRRRSEILSLEMRPRLYPKVEDCTRSSSTTAGIYTLRKKVSISIQHFDPENKKWMVVGATPVLEQNGTLTGSTDSLYFIDGNFLKCCTVPSCKWEVKKNPFVTRICIGAAILNSKLYICGGRDKYSLKKVECLDLESNICQVEPPMSVPRNLLGVVALQGYLYAVGGKNGNYVHDSLERYDPLNRQWTLLSSMHTKKYGMGCATIDDKLYICGGKSSTKGTKCLASAEVYYPSENEWKCISSMKTGRYRCSLVAHCGKLYVLGGCNDRGEYLNSVEVYDPGSDEWKFGPSMGLLHVNNTKAVAIPSVSVT